MPYIEPNIRPAIDSGRMVPRTAGELNYVLTRIVLIYLKNHGLGYQSINDIVGALDGAKAEFQRRVVVPYEDAKIEENGDVYP